MTSGTESETRLALEADLLLEAARIKQIQEVEEKIAAEEAEAERLTTVMGATHAEITNLKAKHEVLESHLYDQLIDGDETDLVIVATSIESSGAQVKVAVGKLKRLTETRLPAQRIKRLTPEKERALLRLDLAAIKSRIHASQLLLAVLPASEIGGDLSIKSEMGMRLEKEESQAAFDLEAATKALEREIKSQENTRDARKNIGVVGWTNPS
jgi:hypothetical protein